MYRYNYMGPRGRRTGHGGFFPGMLLGLAGLMFGGWVILAVLAAVLGFFAMIAGPVIGIFASSISWLFNTIFSGSGVAVGVVIGLIWYFYNKKRNAETEEDREEKTFGKTEPEAEEIIETTHYMFH